MIEVISPGAMTMIQDLGRSGLQEYGFSACGAADYRSMMWANALVGNKMNEGVLEFTISGGMLRFHEKCVIAICGADMESKINQVPCKRNSPVMVECGDILQMGFAKDGCRTYLALAGGFAVPEVLGSVSTDRKCGIGGIDGRPLKAGDRLQSGRRQTVRPAKYHVEKKMTKKNPLPIRVVMGPQADYFTSTGIDTFLEHIYTVSNDSNRMACKLNGGVIETKHGSDMISDGIAPGSIQVAGNGLPMIMMADRQTVGGYAKIATVITPDLPLLAQCRPQDEIRFFKISYRKAVSIYKKEQKQIRHLFQETGGL